jgi:2-methylisocitrate lyase-like PEP mutase family enzyme
VSTTTTDQVSKIERFRELHQQRQPLLMANPWDPGSARLLAAIGFEALGTTSHGSAASLGKNDGQSTRDETMAITASLARAVDVPISADLENCFADDPEGVAATIRLAIEAGVAGCSVEDYPRDAEQASPYDVALAQERVAAAVEAAHSGLASVVLTARADNYLHGRRDLKDTIARLQRYEDAGADVLYAPGVSRAEEIQELVASVSRPLNVLLTPKTPDVSELAALGVRRVSVGGGFALAALGAVAEAAREVLERGTHGYLELAGVGLEAARTALRHSRE